MSPKPGFETLNEEDVITSNISKYLNYDDTVKNVYSPINIFQTNYYEDIPNLINNLNKIFYLYNKSSIELTRDFIWNENTLMIIMISYLHLFNENTTVKLAHHIYELSEGLNDKQHFSDNYNYLCACEILDNNYIKESIINMREYINEYYNMCKKISFNISIWHKKDALSIWYMTKQLIKNSNMDNYLTNLKEFILSNKIDKNILKDDSFTDIFKKAVSYYIGAIK
jgi:hypothetical protein